MRVTTYKAQFQFSALSCQFGLRVRAPVGWEERSYVTAKLLTISLPSVMTPLLAANLMVKRCNGVHILDLTALSAYADFTTISHVDLEFELGSKME